MLYEKQDKRLHEENILFLISLPIVLHVELKVER
jgi:hypothetical protein